MAGPETIATQVDVIDEMREIVVRVNALRHERIGKIERDVTSFGHDVAEIVAAVATDFADTEAEAAVFELERRLAEAEQLWELQKRKDAATACLEEKIAESEKSRRDARDIIRHLIETAGVAKIDELSTAIERSDSLRALQAELSRVSETLTKEGDDLSVAQLQDECGAKGGHPERTQGRRNAQVEMQVRFPIPRRLDPCTYGLQLAMV